MSTGQTVENVSVKHIDLVDPEVNVWQNTLNMIVDIELIYKLLGDKIRQRRTDQQITQEQLASQLQISRTSVTNIELGIQKPPLHLLYEICGILNIEIDEIIPTLKDLKKTKNDVNMRVHGEWTSEIPKIVNELITEDNK